jgi:tetratricopeptide (TPR) repeat protein
MLIDIHEKVARLLENLQLDEAEKILSREDFDSLNMMFRGILASRRGYYDEALKLLTSAFEELSGRNKTYCQIRIAFTYFYKGDLENAKAFAGDTPPPEHLQSWIILQENILIKEFRFLDVLEFVDIFSSGNNRGNHYNHRAISLKNLGQTKKALEEYEIAKSDFLQAGNLVFVAAVNNNIANCYRKLKDTPKAIEYAKTAYQILKSLNQFARAGSALDTLANILLDENRTDEALTTMTIAFELYKLEPNVPFTIESYKTLVAVHLARGDIGKALHASAEGGGLATGTGYPNFSHQIAQLGENVGLTKLYFEESLAEAEIRANFPISIPAHIKASYFGILDIVNNDFGLKGKMAIFAEMQVCSGDLAVIQNVQTGKVIIGVYQVDKSLNLEYLTIPHRADKPFSREDYRIRGKIIGTIENDKFIEVNLCESCL